MFTQIHAESLTHDLRSHEPLNLHFVGPSNNLASAADGITYILNISLSLHATFNVSQSAKSPFLHKSHHIKSSIQKDYAGSTSNAYLETPTVRNWLWYTNIRFRICAYFKKSIIRIPVSSEFIRKIWFKIHSSYWNRFACRDRMGTNEVKQTHQSRSFTFWFYRHFVDFEPVSVSYCVLG